MQQTQTKKPKDRSGGQRCCRSGDANPQVRETHHRREFQRKDRRNMPVNEQLRKEVRERVRTRLQHLSKELGLNEDQKIEIRSLIEENIGNLRPLVADAIATNRAKLQEFLQDRTRVVDLLAKVHGDVESGVKEILTPEQLNKLNKIREEKLAA
jgi:hypothetical protein